MNRITAAFCAALDVAQHLNRRPRAWVRRYTKFFKAQYSEYRES